MPAQPMRPAGPALSPLLTHRCSQESGGEKENDARVCERGDVLFGARSLGTIHHEPWDDIDQRALCSVYGPLAHMGVLPLHNGPGQMRLIMVG
jgi:hypothetical protein